MIRRIFCLLLAISTIFLTGCQLAKPEKAPEVQDRLAGVLVTREHLDLFDMEAYLNDHASEQLKGDHELSDTAGYEGRIYGELIQVGTYEDGDAKYELSFPDVEGYFQVDLFVSATGDWEPEGEYYGYSTGNGGFYDVKSGTAYGDNSRESNLEMTMAVWQEGTVTLYMNPVYQTGDGRVYVTTGNGISADLSMSGEVTHTLSSTRTTTIDGKTESDTTNLIVHAVHRLSAQELQLIQMDENHRILSLDTYEVGSFPEKLTMEKDTAYLIVQTSDGENLERKLCTREDTVAGYLTAQGDLCIPGGVELVWGE